MIAEERSWSNMGGIVLLKLDHGPAPWYIVKPLANIADERARNWNHGRAEPGYNDGIQFTAAGGRFPANAWGLCDMHGNVAEWCRSVYKPYPHGPADDRDDAASPAPRVVRGGSWNDTLPHATSASRWRYSPHKPVYDVGFRVIFTAGQQKLAGEH